MSTHRAYVGIGANLGDRRAVVERAIAHVGTIGRTIARSRLYRTAPWGDLNQPWFVNAVVLIETKLSARGLLAALQAAEKTFGREPSPRWGPRSIDLDLLLYDDAHIEEEGLRVPHPRMRERAFVLVPLAEIDRRFEAMRDALPAFELAGVLPLERESAANMAKDPPISATQRVRELAQFLIREDAVRVRIERGGDAIEVVRRPKCDRREDRLAADASANATAQRVDTIKADLVGIFHVSRPAPVQGEMVEGDRELGYIEALGIRTPVHSVGAGRLLAMPAADGEAVEYGQPLFLVTRGA
ncbi:MAG: 2-amino-4-hydroxy-6-hydroxymethyldihydropteridine diphosphokinase [Candidatus Eremiobacteraeota bacterium]|nr:2-amino-4-hydroxy-6-hydroxymethyldihydropteridine diphosphokinase [Candidatus Eremiobacteraeota bacterium]